jgi:hypothetical protein
MLSPMATVVERRSADEASCDTVAAGPGPGTRHPRSPALRVVATLAVAAGIIHAVAMVDHVDHHWLYGAFFLVVTYGQVLWGIWIYRHAPTRPTLVAGAAANLAVVAVWLLSLTVGVPLGPDAWQAERSGAMDIMATLDELVIVGLVVAIVAPASRLGARLAWLTGGHAVRVGIMLCSASMFSLMLGSHAH